MKVYMNYYGYLICEDITTERTILQAFIGGKSYIIVILSFSYNLLCFYCLV